MACNALTFGLSGLWLVGAQVVPAQVTNPGGPPPTSTPLIRLEAIRERPESPSAKVVGPTIDAIEIRGLRPLPQSALRALIASRVGGAYDLETLRLDSQALYNTGRFSNVAWVTEMGLAGVRVRFVVVERPLIQSIEYQGDPTVTASEILERFRERKVNLRVETLYNGDELGRAARTIEELVAEKGRKHITVTSMVESTWPHSTVRITFRVSEKD
jgi:outer membrane protein insertion porin family